MLIICSIIVFVVGMCAAADACHGNSTQAWAGVYGLAEHIATFRQTVKHTSEVKLVVKSQVVEFGLTDLNLTLARIENCTQGGPLDICGICNFVSVILCNCAK